MSYSKFNLVEKESIIRQLSDGIAHYEISKDFNISIPVVSAILRRHGLSKAVKAHANVKFNVKEIYKELLNGVSVESIANGFDLDRYQVKAKISSAGLPTGLPLEILINNSAVLILHNNNKNLIPEEIARRLGIEPIIVKVILQREFGPYSLENEYPLFDEAELIKMWNRFPILSIKEIASVMEMPPELILERLLVMDVYRDIPDSWRTERNLLIKYGMLDSSGIPTKKAEKIIRERDAKKGKRLVSYRLEKKRPTQNSQPKLVQEKRPAPYGHFKGGYNEPSKKRTSPVGKALLEWRKKRNYSTVKAAEIAGVSASHWNNWEKGNFRITARHYDKVARLLEKDGCTLPPYEERKPIHEVANPSTIDTISESEELQISIKGNVNLIVNEDSITVGNIVVKTKGRKITIS